MISSLNEYIESSKTPFVHKYKLFSSDGRWRHVITTSVARRYPDFWQILRKRVNKYLQKHTNMKLKTSISA